MTMKSCTLIFLLLFTFILESKSLFAQDSIIVKGKIIDKPTNNVIPYANIYDTIYKNFTTTDADGNYELKLPIAKNILQISIVGYETKYIEIDLVKNTNLDINLKPDIRLQEVTITTERLAKTAEVNSSGMTTISSVSVERLPAFLGEKDILKAVQLTPGVQGGQEGARGIFVRGGSPDQTLMLYHNAPVYNVAHIYGFLSVFTTESLSKMDVYKSYIPVQYGGRLSSVINIEPNFGNTEKWKADFSVGAITSKIHFEGPIKKETTSINFSFRECHIGIFTAPIAKKQYTSKGEIGTLKYFFYDMNFALQHKINDKHTLYFSSFVSNDFYTFGESRSKEFKGGFNKNGKNNKLKWLNATSSLELKTTLKKIKISNFYNFSFYKILATQKYNNIDRNYNTRVNNIYTTFYNTLSQIIENGWQTNFEQPVNKNHHLNYGVKFSQKNFIVNNVNSEVEDSTKTQVDKGSFANPKINTLDFYAYADYLFTWKNKFDIKAGLQLFTYHAKRKTFFYTPPKVEVIYHIIPMLSVRASVMQTVQPLHLLTNNTGNIQNDLWVPATKNIEPETAWQYSGGIQLDHPKGYTASVDAYYKTMKHLTEYKFGTTFILDKIAFDEQLLNSGIGKAYGVEFFFAKTKGQFTAWAKYNLGWSTRQFPELNEGKAYFYKYDRRHDVSLVLQYKLKKHFDFSVSWTYGTGWRMTTPSAKYASDATINSYDNANEPLYGNQNLSTYWNSRNNYVLPAYHHLDIGMNYTKIAKRVTHQLNVSIYNVYNNLNIFSVYRQPEIDNNGNKSSKYKQLSLFPILPSIGYTVKFEK